LQAHTATAHARLEARLSSCGWLASTATYAAMLERWLGFYSEVEPELADWAGCLPGLALAQRDKTVLLVEDLLALGRTTVEIERVPHVSEHPRLDDPRRALGALYVLEGATLGGKVIEREVKRRLGLDRRRGTAFFGAYGSDVARRWRELGLVIEGVARTQGIGPMLDAAAETFTALEAWLLA
jgi:heme oxygenase